MIQRNQALTLKEKQAALTSMLDNIQKFGEIETSYAENKLSIDAANVRSIEEQEKQDVERRTQANKFVEEILGQAMAAQSQNMEGNASQQQPEMAGMQ